MGMVAGMMTKTDKIGIIGSHPIPEIIRHINAFTFGVRSVNPKATTQVIWVNSWFDPAKEGAAANSLMDNGADIVTITTDSAAATQTAAKRGLYSIGNDSDMSLWTRSALNSQYLQLGNLLRARLQSSENGTWKFSSDWWGIETGAVDISPFGKMVPKNIQDMVMARKKRLQVANL